MLRTMRAILNQTDLYHAAGAWPRLRTLAAALAVTAACGFLFAGERAGSGLRGDLAEGAALVGSLPQTASEAAVDDALRTALLGRSVSIDAQRFPALVSVTIHNIDQGNCVAALRTTRRLEGTVVVELEGYAGSADCRGENDMTWNFMP
jgi:hypothetical protein